MEKSCQTCRLYRPGRGCPFLIECGENLGWRHWAPQETPYQPEDRQEMVVPKELADAAWQRNYAGRTGQYHHVIRSIREERDAE